MARRKEVFALSRLAWTANGYTMSFRLGVVEIVRTAVDDGVFEDSSRIGRYGSEPQSSEARPPD